MSVKASEFLSGTLIVPTETKDIITLAIAAYGALLSSFNFWQGIRKDGRRIQLRQSISFYTYSGGNIGPAMATLDIVNHGHRPVIIDAPTMRLPNGMQLIFAEPDHFAEFPKRLDDGELVSVRIPFADIAQALKSQGFSGTVTLWPTCKDSTGMTFRARKWRFDVDTGWTKQSRIDRLLRKLRRKKAVMSTAQPRVNK